MSKLGLRDSRFACEEVPMEIVFEFNGLSITKVSHQFPNGSSRRFVHVNVFAGVCDPGDGFAKQVSLHRMLCIFPATWVNLVATTEGVEKTRGEVDIIGRKILTFVLRTGKNVRRFYVRVQRTVHHLLYEFSIRDTWAGKLARRLVAAQAAGNLSIVIR